MKSITRGTAQTPSWPVLSAQSVRQVRHVPQIAMLAAAALYAAPAFAQDAGAGGMGSSILGQLLFFVPLILIFYFLLIRPQQQQRKKHQDMVNNLKRGDTVVTYGGLIAKVTKVGDDEVTIELADGVRTRMVRSMVADVRGKDTPAAAND